MKVLLIDDDAPMFKALFWKFGAEMFYAVSEQEAKAILARQHVDAILMDGYLGENRWRQPLWGADIVERFRAAGITTKIVMFSSDEQYAEKGLIAGANGAFSKKLLEKDGWKQELLDALS